MEKWFTPPTIISLLALGLGVVNTYYLRRRDLDSDWRREFTKLEKKVEEVCEEVDDIKGDLKVLSKQVNLFWRTVEQQMAKKFRDDE